MNPQLIIFDCDGVLVDSEPIAMRVLLETIAQAGVFLGESEAYKQFLGKSLVTISGILVERFGVGPDCLGADGMRLRLFAAFRAALKPMPGIKAALAALSMPRCVASSSQIERVRLSLDLTGLRGAFEPHLFSATMVARGKPAPDLFLHAAEAMGVPPAGCTVIEDSPAGIEAARAAGMRAIGFCGGGHAPAADLRRALPEAGADTLFDDMRDLPHLLTETAAQQRRL